MPWRARSGPIHDARAAGAIRPLPDMLRGPDGGIALRWTSHQAIATVAALGSPLTSTSANIPGQPPPPRARAIARDFAPAVQSGLLLVLDGGVLGNRPP
jgi:tRNA A37 threonylcarbamoyladenosine synthetase subunit TsaC/SUA5/YrdC